MKSKKKIKKIILKLKKEYPNAKTSLNHDNVFELLIATILSAQCTDKRVNKVTPRLFEKYPTPEKMSKASIKDLQKLVKSTGFYKNKAKALKKSSEILVRDFNGEVPKNMKDLLKLRGVARKTANVVLGNAFDKKVGVVVDTHVKRLSRRIGITNEKSPKNIEKDLMEKISKKNWVDYSHLLIFHGRAVCKARKPRCNKCILKNNCESAFDFKHFKK